MNKFAIHPASGMGIDFFATTELGWWTALVIRTGGADTNVELAKGARRQGLRLKVSEMAIMTPTGDFIYPRSEQEVFEMCGLRYFEPERRL